MTLQTSGAIKFSEIQTEFGGSNPISLSEYYAGGSYVPSSTSGTNGAVPSSGTIAMSKFYGTSDVVFTPDGGSSAGSPTTLSAFATYPDVASRTISCNQTATWTWTKTGDTGSGASIASGGTGTSITFNQNPSNINPRSSTFTVSATAGGVTRYWTVQLDTEPSL